MVDGSPGSLRARRFDVGPAFRVAPTPSPGSAGRRATGCATSGSSGASPRTRRNRLAANGARRMVLQHPAAEPVDHGDGAAAGGLHQPGNAGQAAAGQMQRVHQVPGLLADDQIDPLQAVQRLQIEMVVADGEIAALDDRVAEIAGEVGVAEVGRALRSRAQDARSGRRRAGTAPGSSPAGRGNSGRAAWCGSRGRDSARPWLSATRLAST